MNKKYLLIGLILIVFLLIFNINSISYADDSGISDVFTGADDFLAAGSDSEIDETKLQSTSDMIYNILLAIGICVAVIIAGILGIKFMIGSVEEKAQVKDQLIPFVIGCVVVFGALSIWKIVVNIGYSM